MHYCLVFFLLYSAGNMHAGEGQIKKNEEIVKNNTPNELVQTHLTRLKQVRDVATILFNPTTGSPDNKPNPYPTSSINESAVDAVFGAGGFAVDATLLRYIKNFYFYLEFLAKVERVAQLITVAKNKNISLEQFTSQGWQAIMNALQQGEKQPLDTSVIVPDTAAYTQAIQLTIPAVWQDVVKSDFWKAVVINQTDIVRSHCWQLCLKYAISKSFEQNEQLLQPLAQTNLKLFHYIPNMELTYYHRDFTYLRSSAEYFRMHLDLHEIISARYATDITDWADAFDAQGNVDQIKLYQKTQEFSRETVYAILNNSQQLITQTVTQKGQLSKELQDYMAQPTALMELICFSMLKNIQAQLQYLFKAEYIEKTLQVLAKDTLKQLVPSCIPFNNNDAAYLKDIAYIQRIFETAAQQDPDLSDVIMKEEQQENVQPPAKQGQTGGAPSQTFKVTPQAMQGWWSKDWQKSFTKWTAERAQIMTTTGKETLHDLKQVGTGFAKAITDGWQAVENRGLAIWEELQGIGMVLSDNPKAAKEHLQKSKALQREVINNLKDVSKDTRELLQSLNSTVKGTASIVAESIGVMFNAISTSKEFAESLTGLLQSGSHMLIDLAELAIDWVTFVPSVFAVGLDTLMMLSTLVSATAKKMVDRQYKDWSKDVLNSLANVGNTVVATILADCSFLLTKRVLSALQEAVQLAGYLTLMITEITVDLLAVQLYGIAQIAGEAKGDVTKAMEDVRSHKRFIATIANNALMIGISIATDGLAVPALLMNVGTQVVFGGLSFVGAFQDDEAARKNKEEQIEFINRYTQFVENNKIVVSNAQQSFKNELGKKFKAQITNQERDLGFYQNYLSGYFRQTQDQLSFYLGAQLAPQLEPQKDTGLRFADVGALYGFNTGTSATTGVFNLNPSQGFALYNKGRDSFSQEIAVYPAVMSSTQKTPAAQMRKFWFNQKETCVLSEPFEDVDVRFKVIYVLKSFAVGLYIGGKTIDVASIIENKKSEINSAHLAKMIGYRFDNKTPKPRLSVYEHEGFGWLNREVQGPEFACGVWYRIKASLKDTTLKVKIFKEGETEPDWQTIQVQKTEQKTIGIVSPGASVEYQFISPTVSIKGVSQVRPPANWPSEAEREQRSQVLMSELLNPKMGTIELNAINREEIIKGNYIYSTKGTGLKNKDGSPLDEYVVFGMQSGSRDALSISHVGDSPATLVDAVEGKKRLILSDAAVIASLSSGAIFDKSGNYLTTSAHILNPFLTAHPTINSALKKELEEQRQKELTLLAGPFTFGAITLTISSPEDIQKGHFVYKAVSPDPLLRDGDKPKNELYDYFVTINKQGSLGQPFSPDTNQIQSIVTGNVYDRASSAPVDQGFQTGSRAFDVYMRSYGKRRPELDVAINKSADIYAQLTVQKETVKKERPEEQGAQMSMAPAQSFTENALAQAPKVTAKTPQESLLERTQQANAGQVAWGI